MMDTNITSRGVKLASDEEITKMYQALGSALRRRIIEFLGARGKAGVMEIKRALNVSTGSLYYNLELLRDLIDRDENKKYYLTEKGWIAYNLIKNGQESFLDMHIYKPLIPFKLRSKLSLIFHPRWIFMMIFEAQKITLPISLAILAFAAWLCAKTRIELTLFTFSINVFQPPWIIAIKFIVSWLVIYGLTNLFPLIFHGRIGGFTQMFIGLAFSTIPLLITPIIKTILTSIDNFTLGVITLIFQIVSCLLLSTAIGVAKNLRVERALLIGFLIVYLNITLVVFLRG